MVVYEKLVKIQQLKIDWSKIMSLPMKKDWSTFPSHYKDILKAFLGPKFDLAKHESMTESTWIVLYNACKKLYEENDSPILILHEL